MSEQKNLYEQIAELKAQLQEQENKPKTIYDQIRNKDQRLFIFLEHAKLVWKFCRGSLEKKEKDKREKKRALISLILSLLNLLTYVIAAFLISPYIWICVGVTFLLLAWLTALTIKSFETHALLPEVGYGEMLKKPYFRYMKDDNGVVVIKGKSFSVVVGYLLYFLVTFASCIAILLLPASGDWTFILKLIPYVFCILNYVDMGFLHSQKWELCLKDEQNTVGYSVLKQFIYENHIRLKDLQGDKN